VAKTGNIWFSVLYISADKSMKLLVVLQQIVHTNIYLHYFCHINEKNNKMGSLGNIAMIQYTGWIGTPEIIIIVVIVLLLFGGKKIPELMRGVGKGIKEFKGGIAEDSDKKEGSDKKEDKNSEETKTDK
jgi:sec-independent protein translocase protein TatA